MLSTVAQSLAAATNKKYTKEQKMFMFSLILSSWNDLFHEDPIQVKLNSTHYTIAPAASVFVYDSFFTHMSSTENGTAIFINGTKEDTFFQLDNSLFCLFSSL